MLEASLRKARLPPEFYLRSALRLGQALLGVRIVHRVSTTDIRVGRIVETEAYAGPSDAACHARVGPTRRNRALFGPPGHAYVFFIYGQHECFNVVCHRPGAGHAVLIRAVEPLFGIHASRRTDGPGRLTRALGLTRALDGMSLQSESLFLAARAAPVRGVARSPRVGVAYAGAIAEAPWRFFLRPSPYVSKPPKSAIGLGVG